MHTLRLVTIDESDYFGNIASVDDASLDDRIYALSTLCSCVVENCAREGGARTLGRFESAAAAWAAVEAAFSDMVYAEHHVGSFLNVAGEHSAYCGYRATYVAVVAC